MRLVIAFAACAGLACAQVPYSRLLNASKEPGNWLTYNGSYASTHHSALDLINGSNVKQLELKWVFQANSLEKFEATPLVVDGVMYLTEAPNTAVALDAATGREYWNHEHKLPEVVYPCCGKINRGLGILDNLLYMGTLDGKVIALEANSGRKVWERTLMEYSKGYSITHAPLAVKDKIIVGTGGGEYGIRGFILGLDAKTGKEMWRFKTIPEPGEKGNETWGGESWKYGGGSIWLTGSYDPDLNLTYWGIGNPGPDWNPDVRPGDNLYSDSVVALDPDTGTLKWHFQFTPHDEWDWDAVQVPVLADLTWRGQPRKVMLWANRNGFFYVLDRTSGEFLFGTPFVKQTWAERLDEKGRPVKVPNRGPSKEGTVTYPGVQGGTNWFAPSFSPRTGLFYLNAWEDYFGVFYKWDQEYQAGKWYVGGGVTSQVAPTRRDRAMRRDPKVGHGTLRALNPHTGERLWEFKTPEVSDSGVLTTASDLLFTGTREGHFMALDARNGKLLWRTNLGGQTASSPMTYLVNGKQYVSIAVGHALFTFALRDAE